MSSFVRMLFLPGRRQGLCLRFLDPAFPASPSLSAPSQHPRASGRLCATCLFELLLLRSLLVSHVQVPFLEVGHAEDTLPFFSLPGMWKELAWGAVGRRVCPSPSLHSASHTVLGFSAVPASPIRRLSFLASSCHLLE